MYLHDTYFVVGHFHLIMAAALLLASFAAIYFWFPKMFGRMMSERLGKLHFWPTFLALNVVFVGQLLIGWAGMQRRLYDPSAYEFLRHLLPWNVLDLARGLRAGRGAAGVRRELLRQPALRQAGAGQPVAGRHAGVDAAVAAAAPQLRRIPLVVRGPARARHPARARAARTGWRRTRCVEWPRRARGPPTASVNGAKPSNGAVGMAVFLGACAMLFAALLFAYAVVRAQASAWPPPGRRRFRAAPPPATACC